MQAVYTIKKIDINKTEDINTITTILDNVLSKQTYNRLKEQLKVQRLGNIEKAKLLPN
jgi:hypothetical protein